MNVNQQQNLSKNQRKRQNRREAQQSNQSQNASQNQSKKPRKKRRNRNEESSGQEILTGDVNPANYHLQFVDYENDPVIIGNRIEVTGDFSSGSSSFTPTRPITFDASSMDLVAPSKKLFYTEFPASFQVIFNESQTNEIRSAKFKNLVKNDIDSLNEGGLFLVLSDLIHTNAKEREYDSSSLTVLRSRGISFEAPVNLGPAYAVTLLEFYEDEFEEMAEIPEFQVVPNQEAIDYLVSITESIPKGDYRFNETKTRAAFCMLCFFGTAFTDGAGHVRYYYDQDMRVAKNDISHESFNPLAALLILKKMEEGDDDIDLGTLLTDATEEEFDEFCAEFPDSFKFSEYYEEYGPTSGDELLFTNALLGSALLKHIYKNPLDADVSMFRDLIEARNLFLECFGDKKSSSQLMLAYARLCFSRSVVDADWYFGVICVIDSSLALLNTRLNGHISISNLVIKEIDTREVKLTETQKAGYVHAPKKRSSLRDKMSSKKEGGSEGSVVEAPVNYKQPLSTVMYSVKGLRTNQIVFNTYAKRMLLDAVVQSSYSGFSGLYSLIRKYNLISKVPSSSVSFEIALDKLSSVLDGLDD